MRFWSRGSPLPPSAHLQRVRHKHLRNHSPRGALFERAGFRAARQRMAVHERLDLWRRTKSFFLSLSLSRPFFLLRASIFFLRSYYQSVCDGDVLCRRPPPPSAAIPSAVGRQGWVSATPTASEDYVEKETRFGRESGREGKDVDGILQSADVRHRRWQQPR
jgi:hypothetical protein